MKIQADPLETSKTAADAPASPFPVFETWFAAAKKHEPADPNAMCLATNGTDGMPEARMVLLKDWDETGFVFYTNTLSRKGKALAAHPQAAICFHWKSLERQIRIQGHAVPVSDEEADAYFASRPRGSCIGAWASEQSSRIENRDALAARVQRFEEKFASEKTIPRPPHWSGYRIKPVEIEFWRNRESRLHTRILYRQNGSEWDVMMLSP